MWVGSLGLWEGDLWFLLVPWNLEIAKALGHEVEGLWALPVEDRAPPWGPSKTYCSEVSLFPSGHQLPLLH